MKILTCTACRDTIALGRTVRSCTCGKVKGRYLGDGHRAIAQGPYVAFGLHTADIAAVIKARALLVDPETPPAIAALLSPGMLPVRAWAMDPQTANLRKVPDVEAEA